MTSTNLPSTQVFSIIIPTWNNLPYLKCCIESIQKNSTHPHQIVVHVNEGKDGTLDYLQTNKIAFTHTPENAGICVGINKAYTKCSEDYIVYMNDDMYACPRWDEYLLNEIQRIGHERFYLSATMIEWRATGNPCVLAPYDFGQSLETFDEQALLQQHETLSKQDWSGANWPPNVMHRNMFENIQGYDELFSPGMYSDPDISMKLYRAGVREFKGVGKSHVYHFMCKSTKKIRQTNGKTLYLKKWGVSSNWFLQKVLHLGQPYEGPLRDQKIKPSLKDRLKRLFL